MILQAQGYHSEKESGELFMGFFSSDHIKEFVPWETKRAGKKSKKGLYKGKCPLFIQKNEVIDKGWKIK